MKIKQKRVTIQNIIIGIIGLSFVVLFHEFGHFIACKLFGVATPIFSIGFGPALLKIPIGQTTFQLAALPLGGYVSLNPNDLAALPYIKQLIIMLAGIIFNIIFAYAVFLYLSFRGRYHATSTIESVHKDSPAYNAGLLAGDRFIAINGKPVEKDVAELIQIILDSPNTPIKTIIARDGTQKEITITPAQDHPNLGKNLGWIGIQLSAQRVKPTSKKDAAKQGLKGVKNTARNMQNTLRQLFKQNGNNSGIVGPLGIISIAGQSFAYGIDFFLLVLAIISLNLAFFNLLPIPFLDGGQIVSLTIKYFFGGIPVAASSMITRVFLILLLLFIIIITLKDAVKIGKKNK